MESVPDSQLALEAQAEKLGINPKDPGLRFAAALGNGLQEESIRKFVSENIQDQFDGDLNFLYYTTKGESLGGPNSKSITFEEALFGSQSNFRTTEPSLEFDPLMQVALRGPEERLIDFSEIEEGIPVLYIAPEQDLEANPFVPMISEDGSVSEYDTRIVPDIPVLVISQNERLVKVPKNPAARIQSGDACLQSATPYFSDGTNDYYFYTDYYCGGGGLIDNPPGGVGGSTGCDRDLNSNWERIDRVRFTTMGWLNEASNWADGAPEVFFIVFTGSSQSNLAQIKKFIPKVDRSKWKDCSVFNCKTEWVFPSNLEIFNWVKLDYSQTMTIQWYEYDPGDSVTDEQEVNYKDPITGIEYTRTETVVTSDNDEYLGMTPVEYCNDATGADAKMYTTGQIDFVLRID
ncbi:hypothetical protein Aoki45_36700 [Algoriphagus sp. oki45]|uniref:hypothetical protein n=1 Tax=Algoriphagus sp. oki45 TaxID=3067294 RepID=UPI0027F89DFD|nr:hypothetical protein Aoki45_36700 [Algoriphagus sp. oki45]